MVLFDNDNEYNCKIIEYGNGSAELRYYAEPIRKRRKKSKPVSSDNAIDTILKEMGAKPVLLETPEQKQARENLNMINSINRTKKTIYTLARSCEWELFITLTFDGTKIDRTDFKKCMAKVRVWLQHQRHDYASDLKFIIVPELHRDGVSWHCHGLLSDIGNMQLTDSGKAAVGKKAYDRKGLYAAYPTIYNLTGWKWGFSTAVRIHDNAGHKTEKYITKYITKQSCTLAKGYHRYYASQNLQKPKEIKGTMPEKFQAEFLADYCKKTNRAVVYSNTSSNYIETTYNVLDFIDD